MVDFSVFNPCTPDLEKGGVIPLSGDKPYTLVYCNHLILNLLRNNMYDCKLNFINGVFYFFFLRKIKNSPVEFKNTEH